MAIIFYDRYKAFKIDNDFQPLPFIKIPINANDKRIIYKLGETRLDKVSDKYYGMPTYDWLILLANPQFSLEFDIPNNTIIRIPFPLEFALESYNQAVDTFFKL